MTTVTDEQYQRFLNIYDDTYEGLTWDQDAMALRVATESPWDDDSIDGAYSSRGAHWVEAYAVRESLRLALTDAGFSLEQMDACVERMHWSNR